HLMPSTAKSLPLNNAFHPAQNIEPRTNYIKQILHKYNPNISLPLPPYNPHSPDVHKYSGIPPFKQTQNYLNKITPQYFP
uniref:lytic transglycosylase domain-containing protein n=1 Tax=Bacillus sp. WP8 TaxID=756828 RepID=UPI001C92C18C